jgi:hypothetical protein
MHFKSKHAKTDVAILKKQKLLLFPQLALGSPQLLLFPQLALGSPQLLLFPQLALALRVGV